MIRKQEILNSSVKLVYKGEKFTTDMMTTVNGVISDYLDGWCKYYGKTISDEDRDNYIYLKTLSDAYLRERDLENCFKYYKQAEELLK